MSLYLFKLEKMKLMEESQFRGTLLKKEEESGQTKSGEPSLDKSSSSFLDEY